MGAADITEDEVVIAFFVELFVKESAPPDATVKTFVFFIRDGLVGRAMEKDDGTGLCLEDRLSAVDREIREKQIREKQE